jgi:hypothetical protein
LLLSVSYGYSQSVKELQKSKLKLVATFDEDLKKEAMLSMQDFKKCWAGKKAHKLGDGVVKNDILQSILT